MSSPSGHPTTDEAQITLDSIGDGVISIDVDGKVCYLNPAAERMTGWLREEACGRSHLEVLRIIDGDSRAPALNPLTMAILHNRTATLSANSVLIRRDGAELAIEDTAAPMRDDQGNLCGAVIVFHDVSATRARSLEILHRAQHDTLTELPNRLLLLERLTQAVSFARRRRTLLAVMFLDVDRFKQINDSLGHAIGDQLLRAVAHRMSICVRESDTVSRHGGDEFIVLLPEVAHVKDATVCAENLLTSLRRPYRLESLVLCVTVSIGIAVYPTDGADGDTVLRHADIAMLNAKRRGGAQYQLFNPRMSERVAKKGVVEFLTG
ncbi:MAG: diguanylate cyclase domain-containing protein [Steroidobacteraceae bacterium]